jgi:hypothetical protein
VRIHELYHTHGVRLSGVSNGPLISYLVPERVWSDAVMSFALAWRFTADLTVAASFCPIRVIDTSVLVVR